MSPTTYTVEDIEIIRPTTGILSADATEALMNMIEDDEEAEATEADAAGVPAELAGAELVSAIRDASARGCVDLDDYYARLDYDDIRELADGAAAHLDNHILASNWAASVVDGWREANGHTLSPVYA